MVERWWNVSLLTVTIVGSLVLRNCQAGNGTSSCNRPNITRLNFGYFVSIVNGANRTLSCEIHSDTPLKEEPVWRRDYPPSLPAGHSVDNSLCSFSQNKTCILSNLTLIEVVRGHYEGNYTLTAENDCGNASVYVKINIIVPPSCESDYNKPPQLLTPPPPVIQAVQGEDITIKAVYKGNIKERNLLPFWCVATLDGNYRCILPNDNDTVYNVTTDGCPPTDVDCCYFTVSIKIKSLTLGLSQANLTSAVAWLQNTTAFNPGNSTLVVNVRPTLDKWAPNSTVEVDKGHSTEFTCIYNASTNPNITMATWKFEEDFLQHNSDHYTMVTINGTDPINANRILSKLKISNVASDNAGTYTCRCVYNTSTIYGEKTFYSETGSFRLKVKSGYPPYLIIGVTVGVVLAIGIVLSMILITWRIRKKLKTLNRTSTYSNEADQNNRTISENGNNTDGQNGNNNGENDTESDQSSDSERDPLLGKNKQHRSKPMMEFPPDDGVIGTPAKSDGIVIDTFRQVDIPEKMPKRRDSGKSYSAAKSTNQAMAKSETNDQLISGQEYGGIQKEGLTPGHQRANRQHGELITGTINSDTTNTAAANSANFSINVTVNVTGINQSTALHGNDHPPTTDPDTKGGGDATGSRQLSTRPLLDKLPTDHSIASEREGPRRPKPTESSDENITTELSCVNKPTAESLNDLFEEFSPAYWYRLGKCLLKEVWTHKLNAIKKNNPHSEDNCCDEMLEVLLDICANVTWSKIKDALKRIKQDATVEMIERNDSIKDTDKPTLKLLQKYVRNEVALHWHELGIELLEEESVCILDIIEENYHNVQRRCIEMFMYWLNKDPEASWKTLINALEQIDQNTLAAKIKKDILKVGMLEGPQKSKPAKRIRKRESRCEQALLQASGIPATEDLLRMNNHANQSVTPESCAEHKDKGNESPKQRNKPLLLHVSTDHPIESESEMPIKLLPAKCATPVIEKDKAKSLACEPEGPRPSESAITCPMLSGDSNANEGLGGHGRVLNSIAPDLKTLVNLEALLPYLQQHQLVTVDEESYLSNMLYSSGTRAQMLLGYLKHKGDGSLQMFLCSLNLEREHKGHKELADKLKRHMQTADIYCTDFCSDDCKQH